LGDPSLSRETVNFNAPKTNSSVRGDLVASPRATAQ